MNTSQNLVVVGLQWGDEGKGKIVDVLSENFDIIVRFQGGSNAGHTVIVDNVTHKFRIMPTGAVREKKVVIGNGVVVDPVVLLQEIETLTAAGLHIDLLISDRAHLITPYQIQIDSLHETAKGEKNVGTTKRGIGPTYADKVSRIGVRFCDFMAPISEQWDILESMSKSTIEKMHESVFVETNFVSKESFSTMVQKLLSYVGDSGSYLETEMNSGKRVLFEGAQGALLDIDHGTYPYVTSSNCVSSAAASGTGISFSRLDSVLGICKSYLTRVGSGPFPTEIKGDIGKRLQERGKEFGTVTGRPRRCGWLDLVALRYAIRLNGCHHLAITKIDVLTGIDPLKVCVAYEIDGSETITFPASAQVLSKAIPVYKEIEGWSEELQVPSASGTKDFPEQLKNYLSLIEQETSSKIALISIGPKREETIILPEIDI